MQNTPSALTATIDAMSFAHDIILASDGNSVTMSSDPLNKHLITEKISRRGSHDLHRINFKDPLRELVLISEKPGSNVDTTFMTNVMNLAQEAAVLNDIKEVRMGKDHEILDSLAGYPETEPPTNQKTGISLASAFHSSKDVVDPVKEMTFLRRLKSLDESDSEGLNSDRLVLSKIALIRRTKKAVTVTIENTEINDRRDEFSGDTMSAHESNDKTINDNEDDDVTTFEEIKNNMELFHLRKSMHPDFQLKSDKYKKRNRPFRRNR